MSNIAISVDNLYKEYIVNKDVHIPVINGINLEIQEGEFLAIVGRSGSGKSTLMQLMSGILVPTKGDIYYKGKNINILNSKERARFRNREIGFIFQSFFVEKNLTAYENVEIPLLLQEKNKHQRKQKIEEALKVVGLEKRMKHKPVELSGGEIQRLCTARALVTNPSIIFADEPTGQLDSTTAEEIMKLFLKLKQDNKTIIMVTHNEEDAKKYADRIIRIQDGKICCEIGE